MKVLKSFTIACIFVLLFFCNLSGAVPANPVTFELMQPDGGFFDARIIGDENNNRVETVEGYTIVKNADNWWVYLGTDIYGNLITTDKKVGIDIPLYITQHTTQKQNDIQYSVSTVSYSPAQPSQNGNETILILRIEFPDKSHDVAYDQAYFFDMVFNQSSSANSMYNYYKEVSYNNLLISGTVDDIDVNWITAANALSYYGTNDASGGGHVDGLIYEAVENADAYIDFSQYDNDGPDGVPDSGDDDGYVDHLIVVHAGLADENDGSGGDHENIWSRHTYLSPTKSVDGVAVKYYLTVSESSPLGTFAHEFGHDIGLPDLYNTYTGGSVVGKWDLMDYGMWAGSGNYPTHIGGFLKTKIGWMMPTYVSSSQTVAMGYLSNTTGNNRLYQINISGDGKEYFLIEHRNKFNYDTYIQMRGIVIWHIDENYANNNGAIKRTVIEDAQSSSVSYDVYMPWWEKSAFTQYTTPNSNANSGSSTGISITNMDLYGKFDPAPTRNVQFFDNDIPIVSNIATSTPSTSAINITWNTNEFTKNRVYYGLSSADVNNHINGNWSNWDNFTSCPDPYDYSPPQTKIQLTNLTSGTTYYYKIESRDFNNNTNATIPIKSFTTVGTSGAPIIIDWYNNITQDNSTSLTVNESEYIFFNATSDQAITTWNWYKDAASQVNNYDNITLSWSYSGTKSVSVNATNVNGTSTTISWIITVDDITSPLISAISTSDITNSYASIAWTTNENSDSRILYSINADLSNGNWTNQTSDSTTLHTVILTNLNASTQYYFKPYSMDASGNQNITAPTGNFVTNETYVPPEIIFLSPFGSTVINNETDVRTFSIIINQTADVTWLINGTQTQVNNSVTSASYANTTTYSDAGNYNITAVVSNVNGTVSTTWIWFVNDKNREPVWVAIPELVFNEDETNATLDLDDYCADPDGDELTYGIVVEDSHNMTVTINMTNHIVTFTPSSNWFGNTTFKYQANDSYTSVNNSMHNVTVQSVNDIPVINSITANTTVVNESESSEVTVTVFDVEDSTLNYQFDWQSNGTWSTNQTDNRLTYSYSVNGTYVINARVWDSDGANATNNSLAIVVNDITSPAQVIGLTNNTPTWKTVNLSWNANTEPDHLGYAVYENGTLIDITTNTYYNVTGLAGSSSYEFNISAFDDNTNFGSNASVIVTTPVAPPKPAITAWYNNITKDNTTEFVVDETISIYFNVTVDQTIDSYSWYKNQLSFGNNSDNLTWSTNHSSSGVWNITCVIENYNGTDSISWLVTINDIDQKEVPPSTSSGGGGGGSTGEEFKNIILKDVSRVYINKGSHISYKFDKIENNIQYVNFTALSNAGYISTVIEVLESTSALVNEQPDGVVYKNINIWVGKANFATDRNIANQKIGFRVEKKWLSENNMDSSTVIMNRHHQDRWNKLSTIQTGADSNYIYFEASTPGFSPFTITGDVIQMENPADFTVELETSVQIEYNEGNNTSQISNIPIDTTFENNNSILLIVAVILSIVLSIFAFVHFKNNASQ